MLKISNYVAMLGLAASVIACGDDAAEETPVPVPVLSTFTPEYSIENEAITVQVTGENFAETTQLFFTTASGNEFEADVKSYTETTLEAELATGLGVGNYNIKLVNNPQEIVSANQFTVYPKATADALLFSDLNTGNITLEHGSLVTVSGTNFMQNANIVKLVNNDTQAEFSPVLFTNNNDKVEFILPATVPVGDYTILVNTGVQEVAVPGVLTVVYAKPIIDSFSPSSITAGDELTITGNYFYGNEQTVTVDLQGSTSPKTATVKSATMTEIVITTPSDLRTDDYNVVVKVNGEQVYSTSRVTINAFVATPVITSIDKTTYNKGEVMTITGQNLRSTGLITNIGLVPVSGGTSYSYSISVNAEGTQATFTIPNTVSAGTYEVDIAVGSKYSEVYKDNIVIQ